MGVHTCYYMCNNVVDYMVYYLIIHLAKDTCTHHCTIDNRTPHGDWKHVGIRCLIRVSLVCVTPVNLLLINRCTMTTLATCGLCAMLSTVSRGHSDFAVVSKRTTRARQFSAVILSVCTVKRGLKALEVCGSMCKTFLQELVTTSLTSTLYSLMNERLFRDFHCLRQEKPVNVWHKFSAISALVTPTQPQPILFSCSMCSNSRSSTSLEQPF